MRSNFRKLIVMGLLLAGVSAAALTPQTVHAAEGLPVEVLSEFNDIRPANLTVTPQGRIIVSMHPLDNAPIRMMEVTRDGSQIPFPTLDWADGPENGEVGFSSNVAVDTAPDGMWWMLDMGGELQGPQLVSWDTVNNQLGKVIALPESAYLDFSFLQDMALDDKRNKVYIADMTFPGTPAEAKPAIVVVDLETGEARRLMEANENFMPEIRDIVIDGSLVGMKTDDGKSVPHHLSLNPITIDPQNEWVYFGGVNGTKVFRVPAEVLASDMSDDEMAAKIELYGPKPPSDGIKVDGNGNVYITDIEANGIGVTTKDNYELIAQDDVLLKWVDGLAIDDEGYVYGTQNHLHGNPVLNEGVDESEKPFRIIRIKP